MSFLNKLRGDEGGHAAAKSAKAAPPTAPLPENARLSNGLKEFLWLLSDVQNGQLLELGAVSQSTLMFFIDRGFKVYTDDLLRTWKEYLGAEERRLRAAPLAQAGANGDEGGEFEKSAIAERFVAANFQYPESSFNAVLIWDALDYVDAELLPRVVNRLYDLLKPGGMVLGLFHAKKPEAFHRYRVVDGQHIELLPAAALFPNPRVFQNRDLMNLFSAYRTSKTFVGRDQIRECLFLK